MRSARDPPKSGFASADDYYTRSSASQFVPNIRVPTLILTSRDDPLVPPAPFESLNLSPAVTLHIADSGGHLGYIARGGHWQPITWSEGSQGIVLGHPTADSVKQELVTSDIRIHCEVPKATLHEYVVKGQSVSRLTGISTTIGSDPVRYYVD